MSGNIEDNISNSYNSTPITPKIISLKMNLKRHFPKEHIQLNYTAEKPMDSMTE